MSILNVEQMNNNHAFGQFYRIKEIKLIEIEVNFSLPKPPPPPI